MPSAGWVWNAQKENFQKKSLFRGVVFFLKPLGKKSLESFPEDAPTDTPEPGPHYIHLHSFCHEECDELPGRVVRLRRFAEESQLTQEALPWSSVV